VTAPASEPAMPSVEQVEGASWTPPPEPPQEKLPAEGRGIRRAPHRNRTVPMRSPPIRPPCRRCRTTVSNGIQRPWRRPAGRGRGRRGLARRPSEAEQHPAKKGGRGAAAKGTGGGGGRAEGARLSRSPQFHIFLR
jgi:hypothetical protein